VMVISVEEYERLNVCATPSPSLSKQPGRMPAPKRGVREPA
jgi:hypothetical protein